MIINKEKFNLIEVQAKAILSFIKLACCESNTQSHIEEECAKLVDMIEDVKPEDKSLAFNTDIKTA